MAGYSGTPLAKKLGIKPNQHVVLLNPPTDFERTLGALPDGVVLHADQPNMGSADIILFFAKDLADLRRGVPTLAKRIRAGGALWIAWPKKASRVATDLSEAAVRPQGLATGLVDNKVCAVDDTWSALRFVFRLKDRPRRSGRQ